jgi:tetratricopeptide (TPR) repeat protein
MKCPVCRATYRSTQTPEQLTYTCHRCGADLTALIRIHDQAIAHHCRAIEYFKSGNIHDAMVANDQAINLHSRHPSFHALAGRLWVIQGNFDQAFQSWKLTKALDPALAPPLMN